MRAFNSRDGRVIEPVDHTVDFTGKNNSSKGKALLWLLHNRGKFLSARQLADNTGVSYGYLRQRLSYWFNIRYINRKVVSPRNGRPLWSYCIAERGERFVNDRIPVEKHNEYVNDINLWRLVNARQ